MAIAVDQSASACEVRAVLVGAARTHSREVLLPGAPDGVPGPPGAVRAVADARGAER